MSDHEPDDSALLRRIAAGDSDALFALHKRYVNFVYSMAWRVLQDVGPSRRGDPGCLHEAMATEPAL
jgi:hypothetical protein